MLNEIFTNTPLSFLVYNLWRDEAFSFIMAKEPILDLLKATAVDFNPPLYYVILKLWTMLFSNSEIALRSLSLFFFSGTIYTLFLILKNVLKIEEKRAFMYLLIIAFNPFLIFYAFEARMYMMSVFLSTISYYAYFKKYKRVYIIATTLALYTHYFTIFVMAAQIFTSNFQRLLNFIKTKELLRFFEIKDLIKNNYAFIVTGALFIPWLIYLLANHDFFSNEGFWILKPSLNDLLMMPFVIFTGYERVFGQYYHEKAGYIAYHEQLNILIFLLIFTTIISYFYAKFYKKVFLKNIKCLKYTPDIFAWCLIPPAVLFFISQFSTPIYHPRYFIIAVPAILLITIIAFEIIGHYLSFNLNLNKLFIRSNYSINIITLSVLIIFVSFFNDYHNLNLKYRSKSEVSKMYKEIQKIAKPNDFIYLTSELDYFLALYYAPDMNVKIYRKNLEEIPPYVGKVFMTKENFTYLAPQYPQKAFIITDKGYSIISQM